MRGDRRLGGGSPEEAGMLAKAAHRPNLHSMESLPAAGPGDPSAYASGPDASGKVRKGGCQGGRERLRTWSPQGGGLL